MTTYLYSAAKTERFSWAVMALSHREVPFNTHFN